MRFSFKQFENSKNNIDERAIGKYFLVELFIQFETEYIRE